MTTYNPGDRLRVTFEGVVTATGTHVLSPDDRAQMYIGNVGRPSRATIERILPPLVVGQPVPLDRLDEVRDTAGSIVAEAGGAPYYSWDNRWRRFPGVYDDLGDGPFILLRLGDGTE